MSESQRVAALRILCYRHLLNFNLMFSQARSKTLLETTMSGLTAFWLMKLKMLYAQQLIKCL